MLGILCEKPSAARNFAAALGGTSGTFEGTDYRIVAARGHLYEMVDPDKMVPGALAAQYRSWDVKYLPWNEKDFNWKRQKMKDVDQTLDAIRNGLSSVDEIAVATDVDPSGEGMILAAEILEELGLANKKLSRMYFMDEAPKSIQKAFRERKVIPVLAENDEYLMAYYRQRWDFLSMQWTRIARAYGDGRSILRQGRLKSAMVKIVGDRLREIAEFKKVPKYQNQFRDENNVVYKDPDAPEYDSPDQVPSDFTESAVIVDSTKAKTSGPPKLLDLATLSARLVPKGYKAAEILSCYQKLYEAKVVSYPRTEDREITHEQFNEMLPLVDKIAAVVGVDPAILTHRAPRNGSHVKDGGAHGANRPGPAVPKAKSDLSAFSKGSDLAWDIYETLARSFLAMFAEDYGYNSQEGHLEKYPSYKGSTTIPTFAGWKAVFQDDSDTDDTSAGLGKTAKPFVADVAKKKPSNPTMKWLMKQLEKYDVGTGATRTSTYADVTSAKSKYPLLVDKKGTISMAEYGQMSYYMLPGTQIGDLDVTKRLFAEMKDVSKKKADPEKLLSQVQEMIRMDLPVMEANGKAMRDLLGVSLPSYFEGVWNGKDVRVKLTFSGHTFTPEEQERLLAGEEIVLTHLVSQKSGKEFGCKGKLAEMTYQGRKYVGFNTDGQFLNPDGSVPEPREDVEMVTFSDAKGKELKFKRIFGGHRFTDDEIAVLTGGGTVSFEAKTKDGRSYTANGKLGYGKFNGSKYFGFQLDMGNKKGSKKKGT